MSSKRRNDGALTAGDSNASKKPKVNGSITSFFGAPKPAPAPSSSSAPTAAAAASSAPGGTAFDKEKWAAGLTPEQRQLLSLEIETMDPSWLAVLKDEITTPQFIELKKFLDREAGAGKKIFPPREDIYSWYVLFFFVFPSYYITSRYYWFILFVCLSYILCCIVYIYLSL